VCVIISYVNNNLHTVIVHVPAGGGLHVLGFIVMQKKVGVGPSVCTYIHI
jgi:hypothetical protein